jgi:hypothetical protein
MDENTICGGCEKFSGCTWLKQVFYARSGLILPLRDKSLTLSDLKKNEVLKLAQAFRVVISMFLC